MIIEFLLCRIIFRVSCCELTSSVLCKVYSRLLKSEFGKQSFICRQSASPLLGGGLNTGDHFENLSVADQTVTKGATSPPPTPTPRPVKERSFWNLCHIFKCLTLLYCAYPLLCLTIFHYLLYNFSSFALLSIQLTSKKTSL